MPSVDPSQIGLKLRMKMKKITIIRQQKFRDGSVKKAKQQVYGLTLSQAVQSVKNETKKTFDFGQTSPKSNKDSEYCINITQIFPPPTISSTVVPNHKYHQSMQLP